MTTFTLRGTCWPKSLELSNKGGLRELVARGGREFYTARPKGGPQVA